MVKKMNSAVEDFISLQSPTAQVKTLGLELLSDRKPHSRRELISYIKARGIELCLNPFREGHLSGGIQDILSSGVAVKIEKGTYILADAQLELKLPPSDEAVKVCKRAISEIQDIARHIDYITANEAEEQQLIKLKKAVDKLNEIVEYLK